VLPRRRLTDGELAYYACLDPARTTLAELVGMPACGRCLGWSLWRRRYQAHATCSRRRRCQHRLTELAQATVA
jgi:hypothetical protein